MCEGRRQYCTDLLLILIVLLSTTESVLPVFYRTGRFFVALTRDYEVLRMYQR